jgi:hypothetical protein
MESGAGPQSSLTDELAVLKEQAENLGTYLDGIKRRIDELEKGQNK